MSRPSDRSFKYNYSVASVGSSETQSITGSSFLAAFLFLIALYPKYAHAVTASVPAAVIATSL